MKARSISLLLLLLSGAMQARVGSNVESFKITKQEMFSEPVSPLLYGNFIELGYGIQVESMWAEMFFNRSFEKFYPYREINKAWFDLYYDEKDPSLGYERDWSKFDWYHSGYEHNAWFAAPGNPGSPCVIDDSSTFLILDSPVRNMSIELRTDGAIHGSQYLAIHNGEESEWAGLAQEGKFFMKGESYLFKGYMKSESGTDQAEVRIYPQGTWDKPIIRVPVEGLKSSFSSYEIRIDNMDFEGYVTFCLWIPAGSIISVDDFSMMPTSNIHGWKRETIEVFRELNPTVVRFPGGCFASFYDWKDGIGPYSERNPQDSYFWGGMNYNDVGTAEFANLCLSSGAEMSICVNVYHPSKRHYDVDFPTWQAKHNRDFTKFMSTFEGAKSAADWVAYCNLTAGNHPMADLRAEHGYPAPFGVKFWELDNELHRWFEPLDYAWATVIYAKTMKAVDPDIQIGMSSYGGRPGGESYHDALPEMLEIAGPYIDFLADRGDAEGESLRMLDKLRAYNLKHGTSIQYCDTEWLAYNTDQKRNYFNLAKDEGSVSKSFMFSKWTYALNLLNNFMGFQRLGEELLFVNFNNLANTHSQSAMETPKEGAFLTASGRALQLLSNSPAAWLLHIEDYEPNHNDEFQVQAAWDLERKRLVIYVYNRSAEERDISIELSELGKDFTGSKWTQLYAGGPLEMNTLDEPGAIKLALQENGVKNRKNELKVKSKPWSFQEIILE
jgi:alpha-N-arabinofuranosidase